MGEAARRYRRGLITIVIYPRVSMRAVAAAKRFLSEAQYLFTVEHPVTVEIVPAYCVEGPNGRRGWGAYLPAERRIMIGGWMPAALHNAGVPLKEAEKDLLRTIAHEFVHYEQHRDGRALNERGVQRRADAIVERYLDDERILR